MSKSQPNHRIETQTVHLGNHGDATTGAVIPSIVMATTFERQPDYSAPSGFIYGRSQNPNRQALEETLAALEGGEVAYAFASGQAATNAAYQMLKAGDHVIAPAESYFGTRGLLREIYEHLGLTYTFVDTSNLDAVQAAFTPQTKLVWVETPSNPTMTITDIRAVADLAHAHGALLAVDNTFASPIMQRPLSLGADFVMHSTTKFISGHTDVTGGALVFARIDDVSARAQLVQYLGGAVPSPFDCWLILRGIRTLALRVRQQAANALALAQFLADHPAVETVFYPGLASHRGHSIAASQMYGGFGGMLSVCVQGGAVEALKVAAQVQLFTRATSLGGIESLIEHRFSIEGPTSSTPPNLLRISVGIEHIDDLIQDIRQALHTLAL